MDQRLENLKKELRLKDIVVPDGQSAQNIYSKSQNPIVQFHIRPYFHLNTVHFAILQLIKKLVNLGYRCTIVLFDYSTIHAKLNSNIISDNDAVNSMDFFYESLIQFGITKKEMVEIIPESVLWKTSSLKFNYYEKIIKLSRIADKVKGIDMIDYYFNHLDTLTCLVYEGVLKPDFVLTGGKELESIWPDVRKRENLGDIFGNDFISPIMLIPLQFAKHNDVNIKLSTSDENDPFSSSFNFNQNIVTSFTEEYKTLIHNLSRINENINLDTYEIIHKFRTIMYK